MGLVKRITTSIYSAPMGLAKQIKKTADVGGLAKQMGKVATSVPPVAGVVKIAKKALDPTGHTLTPEENLLQKKIKKPKKTSTSDGTLYGE